MTDLSPDVVDRSTSLEADAALGPSGAGAPRSIELEPKVSLREAVAESFKADKPDGADKSPTPDDKAGKGAEKPADEAKASDLKEGEKALERAADGKFAAKQAEADEAKSEDKADAAAKDAQPKPNGHIEPPAKFLPDAKETWRNTPRPVQRDVENLVREHETELTRHREAAERYEPIRQFDELARQNGRAGVHESLAEVARLEDMMQANPVAALNHILMQVGPRKADGQPVSLFEMAQVIVQQGPQGYQKMVSQAPQQQRSQNDNPEVSQLRAEMAQMREQQVAATVIEPFKAGHPRYEELQQDIAFFLKSDKIPTSLSPHDRLEAAYDMAARINPASQSALEPKADPDPGDRVDDLSGSKSIKSAPGAVSPDMEPDRGGSTREILRAELKRQKVS